MFEFLSNVDANDALGGVHYALRRITHRRLMENVSSASSDSLAWDERPIDSELGLKLIREIELAEKAPLNNLDANKAYFYKEQLATLAQEMTRQTYDYDKKVGLDLLKEWRDEPLTNVSTISLPSRPLSPAKVWIVGIYLTMLVSGASYLIYALWPNGAWDVGVRLMFFGSLPRAVPPETRVLLLVMILGALGSSIHTVRSFTFYVGNRALTESWFWWFLLQPFIGVALAVVCYVVIRGSFLSPSAGVQDINLFGIAALSGLVGLFSSPAAQKIEEIFGVIFKSTGDEMRSSKLKDKW